MRNDILYIVVIYGIAKEDSRAWQALRRCLSDEEMKRDVYVHDNTGHNVYLAQAYNEGVAYAKAHGYLWIALFDADACPTGEYVAMVKQIVAREQADAVWAPTLVDERGKQLSPKRHWGIPVAFNSGLLLPVAVLDKVGGFNSNYPLDYLDYRLCYDLQQQHISLRRLEVTLTHSLSIENYSQVSRERYMSVLEAERRFAKETGNVWRYRCLLMCRIVKWSLTRHKYIRESMHALMKR